MKESETELKAAEMAKKSLNKDLKDVEKKHADARKTGGKQATLLTYIRGVLTCFL